jgi:hypothetical protein
MTNKKKIKAEKEEEASEVSSNTEDTEEEAVEAAESTGFPTLPNDKVRESLTDLIEYYTEMAFLNRRERIKNMEAADVRTRT